MSCHWRAALRSRRAADAGARLRPGIRRWLAAGLAGALWPAIAQAQNITIDGSLSPAQTLTGPNYTIGAGLGQQAGGNLFQSFGIFGLPTGTSATFTGPGTATDVLGRVTAGSASSIDGQVASSIAGSNLYLVNPSGITFQSNATLAVTGNFHATTANYIKLRDGATFLATTSPPSTLTPSAPSLIGFTTATPAALTINGSSLGVSSGKILDLSGGTINVSGATLSTSGLSGRLMLTGVGSAGELEVSGSFSTVSTHAPVQITNSLLRTTDGTTATSHMSILGSTITLTGTEHNGDAYAPGINLGAELRADSQITITNSNLHSNTIGIGRAGGMVLATAQSGGITIDNSTVTTSTSGSGGPSGGISIGTGTLVLTNGARMGTTTANGSPGGSVGIDARSVTVANGAELYVTATSFGRRGTLRIQVIDGITLANGTIRNAVVLGAISSSGGTLDGIGDGLSGGTASLTTVSGTTLLQGANTYSGGTTVNGGTLNLQNGASLSTTGALTVNGGTFDLGNNVQTVGALAGSGGTIALGSGMLTTNSAANTSLASTITGTGSLVKQGSGILALSGANAYSGGTTVSGGLINFAAAGNLGTGMITLNRGGLQWAAGNTADISSRLAPLGANGGTVDTNGNTVNFAAGLSGSGGLTKQGSGTLILSAANGYTGGTTVNAGTVQLGAGGSLAAGGALTVNGGTFALNGNNQTVGALAGTGGAITLGSGTLTAGDANSTLLAAAISGSGGLVKQGSGTLTLTAANTFTGGTTLNAGGLIVNGSLSSGVTVNGGTLGGSGSIGGLVVNGGILAPGNSIGTLTVNGSFVQNAGSVYQVETNSAGQSDRINVNGPATINGATVQVLAQAGTYARNTTYTILSATAGVTGAYSGVSSNFAFLTPSLSYDANNVYLLLFQNSSAFAAGAQTPNQYAVGTVLDQVNATATGDLNTVLNALSALSTQQGPAALNAISGQPYADFGTLNTSSSAMFMNALGQQMAGARGASTGGQRQALAQACDIAACDGASPLSAWARALGGLGSVLGDSNASTFTYNFGGAAAGVDYRLDPRFLVGIGAGYTHGTQWVNSFLGQGWSDSVSVAAYGSFTQAGFYADALAGYAYSNNQLQRQILIPGLQQRTASGSTGANQFLGQVESGYKLGVYAPASATITPFGRLQVSSVTQNAFSESGAQSLNLNVAQQTTNSLRTTIGADLASAIGIGNERKVDLDLRLGWQHEFADTGRPITAAFADAPGNSFTVFGATPARDSAVIGFQAMTAVAEATQIYLRYDGAVGGGTDNHALNVGVRFSW